MVKIVVGKKWDDIRNETFQDVKSGLAQSEDLVVYLDRLEDIRLILTPQRIKMLRTVKQLKPESLYALSKLMKKDIKTICADTTILNKAGLLKLEKYSDGKRIKVRPSFSGSKITVELAV